MFFYNVHSCSWSGVQYDSCGLNWSCADTRKKVSAKERTRWNELKVQEKSGAKKADVREKPSAFAKGKVQGVCCSPIQYKDWHLFLTAKINTHEHCWATIGHSAHSVRWKVIFEEVQEWVWGIVVTGDHDFSWIQVFCEIGIGYLTRYMVNYLLQCFQLYLRTPLGLSGAAQPDC